MRNIPGPLKAHIDSGTTTLCRLLKITMQDGREVGMATLDRDVDFNGLTYTAKSGFDPSIIASDNTFGVDNGEVYSLFSLDNPIIDVEMADRGELDDAEWVMYLVNYKDLSMGHIVLDAGDIGEVKTVDGTVFIPELLSYAMRLRQSIGHVDSRTCRAIFGSAPVGQLGCGVDVSPLWQNHIVTAVSGDEPKVSFVASGLVGSIFYNAPAMVTWTTGNNTSSRLYKVEVLDETAGLITLFDPLPFIVEPGDTFDIRKECNKLFETCRDDYSNELNFKGEPLIPTGQAADTPQ